MERKIESDGNRRAVRIEIRGEHIPLQAWIDPNI